MKRKFYPIFDSEAIANRIAAQPLTTSSSRTGVEKEVDPTEQEKLIVYNIVLSAVECFNSNCYDGNSRIMPEKLQAVCDMAETLFDNMTDWKYNGYISIYCKLKEILREGEVE